MPGRGRRRRRPESDARLRERLCCFCSNAAPSATGRGPHAAAPLDPCGPASWKSCLVFVHAPTFCLSIPAVTETAVRRDDSTVTRDHDETLRSFVRDFPSNPCRDRDRERERDGEVLPRRLVSVSHSFSRRRWKNCFESFMAEQVGGKRQIKKKLAVAKVNSSSSAYFGLFSQLDLSE